MTEQQAAEDEVLDVLVAATEAFNNIVLDAHQPRSIAVSVEASNNQGMVEIVLHDHVRRHEDRSSLGLHLVRALMDTVEVQITPKGTTVRLKRVLGPRRIGIANSGIASARDRLDLLWRNPIFAPLPGALRERLAVQLVPVSASVDQTIIHEGDHADRFFLIANGEVDVSAARCHIATLGPGDHIGEIALIRHVPRTATIVAATPVELYALTAEDFLSVITSHHASTRAAESTVATRLAELQDMLGRTA